MIERDRIRIGREIAQCLKPVHTAQEVADYFGITQQAVSKIEALALFKVSVKIKELLAQSNSHE
jgi:DNA-directed RNA polymerase sigma subunit (sigma70/sigma32)